MFFTGEWGAGLSHPCADVAEALFHCSACANTAPAQPQLVPRAGRWQKRLKPASGSWPPAPGPISVVLPMGGAATAWERWVWQGPWQVLVPPRAQGPYI